MDANGPIDCPLLPLEPDRSWNHHLGRAGQPSPVNPKSLMALTDDGRPMFQRSALGTGKNLKETDPVRLSPLHLSLKSIVGRRPGTQEP
jgi:hypothetical protein